MGLSFPPISDWANFICEACTVRQILQREVRRPKDDLLLMLERMRIIDMAWSWSSGTHATYQSKLRLIRKFERAQGLRILVPSPIKVPPDTPDIPLMWCMEAASVKETRFKANGFQPSQISYTTVRAIRSAASQFWAWDGLIAHPSAALLTREGRLTFQPCRASDGYSFSLFASGLSARMGESVNPSLALLSRHVHALDRYLDHQFRTALSPGRRHDAAIAALANLVMWLGWLRTSEAFSLAWADVSVLHPSRAAERDLPANVGLLSLLLLPETKSSRTARADVIIAFTSASGLRAGRWFSSASSSKPATSRPQSLIFSHSDGSPWTSLYFRQRFLYPCLQQEQASDPYLQFPSPETIETRFWSLHCYRRGARTHVSRASPGLRRATTEQIYEHARWRYSRSSQPVDALYRDWTPFDRVKITHMCQ